MPREPRRAAARCYYRVERRGDKVRRIYVGPRSSPVIQLIERIDHSFQALTRLNNAAELADDGAERDQLLRAFDARAALINRLSLRTNAMKIRSGSSRSNLAGSAPSCLSGDHDDLPTHAEFLALVTRAEKGSETAQRQLNEILDRNPHLWRAMGDLGNLVESHLVDLATHNSIILRESLLRRLLELRGQLSKIDDDPLEELLVHRVLVSWLEIEVRQIQAMQAKVGRLNQKHQLRLDQAQRRHVESINALRDFQNKAGGRRDVDKRS